MEQKEQYHTQRQPNVQKKVEASSLQVNWSRAVLRAASTSLLQEISNHAIYLSIYLNKYVQNVSQIHQNITKIIPRWVREAIGSTWTHLG